MAIGREAEPSDGIQATGPNINVHIERIVLEGIDLAPHQLGPLQAAVEAELARLLAADGLGPRAQGGGAIASVAGGTVHLGAEAEPGQMGRQIAQAIYGGIAR